MSIQYPLTDEQTVQRENFSILWKGGGVFIPRVVIWFAKLMVLLSLSSFGTFALGTDLSVLTINVGGNGSGIVTIDPPSIECPSSCVREYDPNTSVTLAVTPLTNSIFTGWSGDCAMQIGEELVILNAGGPDKSTNYFVAFEGVEGNVWSYSAYRDGGSNARALSHWSLGIGNCNIIETTGSGVEIGNGGGENADGILAGQPLIKWNGDVSDDENNPTIFTFTLDGEYATTDTSVVVKTGGEQQIGKGVITGPDCSKPVTTDAVATVIMDTDKSCEATFSLSEEPPPPETANLTISTIGNGTVSSNPAGIEDCSGSCNTDYPLNTSVTLIAKPATDSTFAGWKGDCSDTFRVVNVSMDADKSCEAIFLTPPPPPEVGPRFAGFILDSQQNPIVEAIVSVNGIEAITNAEGFFEVFIEETERYVINVTKENYVFISQIRENLDENLVITMNLTETFQIDPVTESEVTDSRGTQIQLPPNALVDENGNPPSEGTSITVEMYTYDLENGVIPELGDMTGTNSLDELVSLESTGAFWVEFTDDVGIQYNLAVGQTAIISVLATRTDRDTVPLWFYDEENGIWIENGVANLIERRFQGTITSQSFSPFLLWNFDWPIVETADLTVNVVGGGTVASDPAGIDDCNKSCSDTRPLNTSIILLAKETQGSIFEGWSGDCTGTFEAVTVNMDMAKNCTATFTAPPPPLETQQLTVTVSGTGTVTSDMGGINCGPVCSDSYANDNTVQLTATPVDTFTGWAGDCSGTEPVAIVIMDVARNCEATFSSVKPPSEMANLTVNIIGNGTVESEPTSANINNCIGSCNADYPLGTQVTLVATAATNFTLEGWSGECINTFSNFPALTTITMDADKSCEVIFTEIPLVSFTGTIRDSQGTPILEATVKVNDIETLTNEAGFFEVSVLKAEIYELNVRKEGYMFYSQTTRENNVEQEITINAIQEKASGEIDSGLGDQIIKGPNGTQLKIPDSGSIVDANGNPPPPGTSITVNFYVYQSININQTIYSYEFVDNSGTRYILDEGRKVIIVVPDDPTGGENTPIVKPIDGSSIVEEKPVEGEKREITIISGERFAGFILDEQKIPIAEAIVEVNGSETKTDAKGFFKISVTKAERYVINVRKGGYAFVSQIKESSSEKLAITLKTMETYPIDPLTGGEIKDSRGTRIVLPPNALVDADGNLPGTSVTVGIRTYDLEEGVLLELGDMTGNTNAGTPVPLESLGAFWIEFTDDSGIQYNVAEDQTATISVPVNSEEDRAGPPPLLWSYNETTAVWEEESTVSLVDGRFESTVTSTATSRFPSSRAWNVDRIIVDSADLTVNVVGNGTVTSNSSGIDECSRRCSDTRPLNTPITLLATAANNSTFEGWSGDCAGTFGAVTVTMDAAKNCTATFVTATPPPLETQQLTVTVSGTGTVTSDTGGINCGSACSASYTSGSVVQLMATPADTYTFTGWGGSCSGTTSMVAVTMDAAKNCTATFSSTCTDCGVRFAGSVNDPQGNPVVDAIVEVNGTETRTSATGSFEISVTTAERYVINIRRSGYALVSLVRENADGDMNIIVNQTWITQIDPSVENRIEDPNNPLSARIELPANVLVDADGNLPPEGTLVTVEMYTYNLDNGMLPELGDMTGTDSEDSTDVAQSFTLESTGAFRAEFTANGRQYNVAVNQTATISVLATRTGVETVPLWFYNATRGTWVDTGTTARLVNGRFQTSVTSTVTRRFPDARAWNFDWCSWYDCFQRDGIITNINGDAQCLRAGVLQPGAVDGTGTLMNVSIKMVGGISNNLGDYSQDSTVVLADPIATRGIIEVDPADTGKQAEIFVYGVHTDPRYERGFAWYMLNGCNTCVQVAPTNDDGTPILSQLAALSTKSSLPTRYLRVDMYSGNFVYPGFLDIFFGYRVVESGKMVFNATPTPIKVTINP